MSLCDNCGSRDEDTCAPQVNNHVTVRRKAMITVAPHIRSIVDHDGAVLLDIPRNAIATLDSTGAYIWGRLQRGLQVDAIVAELARDTGADVLVVAKDVEEFLEQLKLRHLVSLS
jgi:hypothetical protein